VALGVVVELLEEEVVVPVEMEIDAAGVVVEEVI
jgi:hypothetical protein